MLRKPVLKDISIACGTRRRLQAAAVVTVRRDASQTPLNRAMRNSHPPPSPVRFAESGNTADRVGLLTLPAAATTLAISKRTLERLIASGEFPRPVKIGRASRVLSSDLVHYLEQLRRKRGNIIGNS